MKRDRFIMNIRFLKRKPPKYKILKYQWDWLYERSPSYVEVERTPVKPYSYVKRIVTAKGFEKSLKGYRKREYKFFPKVNSFKHGGYKNVYKAAKNPLCNRISF